VNAAFRGRAVVLPGGVRPAVVRVRDGVIEAVQPYDADVAGGDVIDAGDALLLPGLVDAHVHLNDPGRDEWEGFASGTMAAAAGGVTTLIDMPLNSVPATTTLEALRAKQAAAAGRCHVDVAFWGGVVPGNVAQLEPLWHAGVCGFKCFLAPSGVDEFAHVTEVDLRTALPILARLEAPLLVHAESPSLLRDVASPAHYASWLASRPDDAEVEAVRLVTTLAAEYGARVHIVHVSAAASLRVIRDARARGIGVTAETCPHYLCFDADCIGDDALQYKCAPPIRDAANRSALWEGLAAGDIDLVASDHSPAPPAMKRGDWGSAWGGIASLQLTLPVLWTEARARGHAATDLARWLAQQPARLANLGMRKGAIEAGRDADFVVFEPDVQWRVDATRLHHRHALTPYDGMQLSGAVRATYLRGACIYADDAVQGTARGQLLERHPND